MTTIISVSELDNLLKNEDILLLDCRFDLVDEQYGQESWRKSHIPSSIYVHLNKDLSAPVTVDTGRHPLPDVSVFKQRLKDWGLTASTHVVAYDDGAGMFAARLWWLLRWLGHTNVSVLDGGWSAWTAADKVATTEVRQAPVSADDNYIDSLTENSAMVVNAEDVSNCLANEQFRLWDARDPRRFSGEIEPVDKKAGHIPGAENVFFMQNLSDGLFMSPDELKQRFNKLLSGDDPATVVHMCGSGVTACQNQLAMEIAGLSGGKLYPGSWSEWINDPDRPTEP